MVTVLAQQQPVAVALGQHPAPRELVDDLSQATDTPHSLFRFEREKATKLVLGVGDRAERALDLGLAPVQRLGRRDRAFSAKQTSSATEWSWSFRINRPR